ncbi:MAG: hypothetical protein IT173_07510 [Acidobacteria bacterium]|nr:hypothetical protein [Acidobacteriota bacterium]
MIDMPIDLSRTTTQAGVFLRERDRPVIVGKPSSASTVANIDALLAAMRANFASATFNDFPFSDEDEDISTEPINTYRLRVPLRFRGKALAPAFDAEEYPVLFDE